MDRSLLNRSGRAAGQARYRNRWYLRLESLEARHLLATGLTVQAPQRLASATEVLALTTADLNGDGWLDVIFATRQSGNITVLLGNAGDVG